VGLLVQSCVELAPWQSRFLTAGLGPAILVHEFAHIGSTFPVQLLASVGTGQVPVAAKRQGTTALNTITSIFLFINFAFRLLVDCLLTHLPKHLVPIKGEILTRTLNIRRWISATYQ
jgi:hypothetical protein